MSRGVALHDPALDRATDSHSHGAWFAGLSGSGDRTSMAGKGRQLKRRNHMVAALENAVLLVDRNEKIGRVGDIFRGAKEQIAPRFQSEMENRHRLGLKIDAEINQKVAAGDEIDPGKRRIANDAM